MENLLQGDIRKTYFKYLIAAFGSAMISCIYGMVDAAVVGHDIGPLGSATLAVILPIWTIIYSLGLLIGIGGSVAYSYCKGQDKIHKANAYFTLSLALTSLVGILCWLGIVIFDDELLYLFGADDTILPLAKEYLLTIKFVIPAFPFTQMLAAFLRNDNAPGLAAKAVLIGGVFNIFGDLFFVFGLNMGIFGAGLATAMGACISVIVMLVHFFTKKNTIHLTKVYGPVHKSKILTTNGFSSFVSDVAMGIVAMLFNRQIMRFFGSEALAVYGVVVQITVLVQCSTYGVGQAAQPIITTNFGAEKYMRVRETNKHGIMTAGVFGLAWIVASMLFPNAFVHLYMRPTENVLAMAPAIIRIYGLSFLLLPINIYSTYYFQSVMKPITALIVSLARGVVLCSALVYVLPALLGSSAIWWVMPITELLVAIYALLSMKRK